MSAKRPSGWSVRVQGDEESGQTEVKPPPASKAEIEIIRDFLNRLIFEYFTGRLAWEDFPPVFRPRLLYIYRSDFDTMIEEALRHRKPDSPIRMAERFTDMILTVVKSGVDLSDLDPRLASDDPNKQLAGARTVAANLFNVKKRMSLARAHRHRNPGGADKKP